MFAVFNALFQVRNHPFVHLIARMSFRFSAGKDANDRRAQLRRDFNPVFHELHVRRAFVFVRLSKIISNTCAADVEAQLECAPFEIVDE